MSETGTSQRRAWTVVLFAAVALGGAALQARGALVPSFQAEFGVSEGRLGLLTPLGTLGFVGPVVVVGALAGHVDVKRFLVVGLALSGVTLALVGIAPTYIALLALVLVRSAAIGVVRALDRPVIGHLYPADRGRVFTLEGMAWAVGATLGPVVATLALAVDSWRLTYVLLGAGFLPVAVFAWRLDLPTDVANEESIAVADVSALLADPTLVAMSLALVLVGGIESTFFTWLPYYATGFLPRATANLALSVFLAAYVPGRLAFSAVADRLSPPDLVLGSSAALVGVLAVLFGTDGLGPRAFLGVTFAAGALVSGFFPLLLTWGVESEPGFTGPVNAIALVAGQTGFFVVPATVGVLAELYTIESAMLVQVGLAAVLVCLLGGRRALGAARAARRQESS